MNVKSYNIFFVAYKLIPLPDLCAESSKPNIVYIMADEFGYYQPGFMGSKVIKTPNLDRMANGGMVFRNMLAGNASCAPTRCSLLTGKHPGHAAIRSNQDKSIRGEEITIAEVLKQKGYRIGKKKFLRVRILRESTR